jgi:hypothetical protein
MGIGKLSFVFRWVLGISLVCLVPLVPRFRWSRWLSFSSCFAGVLRDPLPPKPPYQPLGWSYGMPITLCTPMPMLLHFPCLCLPQQCLCLFPCPCLCWRLSQGYHWTIQIVLPCHLFCKFEVISYCPHWNTVYHVYVFWIVFMIIILMSHLLFNIQYNVSVFRIIIIISY